MRGRRVYRGSDTAQDPHQRRDLLEARACPGALPQTLVAR
ncbi:MAG: hypothetical protein QOF81_2860 [Acidimicrobiaceae bacterium]|jgi:hypothetical protein|nr:hypothetical protein [Acidimicrobiaceae bacterium]MDQ1417247.1 hypothetical protein [Acidimicrobiaceae bacterium]